MTEAEIQVKIDKLQVLYMKVRDYAPDNFTVKYMNLQGRLELGAYCIEDVGCDIYRAGLASKLHTTWSKNGRVDWMLYLNAVYKELKNISRMR